MAMLPGAKGEGMEGKRIMAKNISIKVTGLLLVLLVNMPVVNASESNWTSTSSRANVIANQPAAVSPQITHLPNFRWQLNYNLYPRISNPSGILGSFMASSRHEDIFYVETEEGLSATGHPFVAGQ